MGRRFGFGSNWKAYAQTVDDSRIAASERGISEFLGSDLSGQTFIDVGSGSGIHGLAARRLGADRVFMFDYDTESVECSELVMSRFASGDDSWKVVQGSVLDDAFISGLGVYDIVYSWGVLHHTGEMWRAIENAMKLVAPNGRLFIAIYNDQGWKSRFWWYVKYVYNCLPRGIDQLYGLTLGYVFILLNIIKYTVKLKPMVAIRPLIEGRGRGMNFHHDILDWMGGFPYEFATYSRLEEYGRERGFHLEKGQRRDSLGCHQMLFRRD